MRCPLGYILFQLEQEWNTCHLWLRRNTSDSSGSFQSYYSFKENIFFFNIKLNRKSKYFQQNILRKIMSAFRVIRVKQQISKQTTLSIMLTLVYKANIWDQNSVLVVFMAYSQVSPRACLIRYAILDAPSLPSLLMLMCQQHPLWRMFISSGVGWGSSFTQAVMRAAFQKDQGIDAMM